MFQLLQHILPARGRLARFGVEAAGHCPLCPRWWRTFPTSSPVAPAQLVPGNGLWPPWWPPLAPFMMRISSYWPGPRWPGTWILPPPLWFLST